jgi:hypothetical protein
LVFYEKYKKPADICKGVVGMLRLTIFEYFREIKNVFISIFIAVLCLLITILYSFLNYENGKLQPFEELSEKKGFVTYLSTEQNEEYENYLFERDISEYPGIETEYISYTAYLKLGEKSLKTYVYDELIWNNWKGRLKDGRWFKKSDTKSDTIPVIIGGDTTGYNVGDIYSIDFNGTKVEIIGLMQDSTEVFDMESYSFEKFNYSGFYKAPNTSEGAAYAICQYEVLENTEVYFADAGNWAIYIYDDSLSDEECDKLNADLNFSCGGCGKDLDTFIKESKMVANRKIYTYIPTILVSILIMIAAIYCLSFVKVQNSEKIYSVYYLNGASKPKIYLIVIGYVLITTLFSAIFYIIGGLWFDSYARRHNIMYSFWGASVKSPVLLYLFFGIIMSTCLILELRNKTAVELLKSRTL